MNRIKALEDRGADLAECLSHQHSLGSAAHVEKNVTCLNERQLNSAPG
jgi:hypothetical protein